MPFRWEGHGLMCFQTKGLVQGPILSHRRQKTSGLVQATAGCREYQKTCPPLRSDWMSELRLPRAGRGFSTGSVDSGDVCPRYHLIHKETVAGETHDCLWPGQGSPQSSENSRRRGSFCKMVISIRASEWLQKRHRTAACQKEQCAY